MEQQMSNGEHLCFPRALMRSWWARLVNTLLVESTDLTRAINRMTEELHERLVGNTARPAPE